MRVRRFAAATSSRSTRPTSRSRSPRAGDYRIEVDPQGGIDHGVRTRSGQAEVYGESASTSSTPGQGYRFYGTDACQSRVPCSCRNRRARSLRTGARQSAATHRVSARYVSTDVIGLPGPRPLRRLACRSELRQRVVAAARWPSTGRRIAMATGRGSIRGAGPGSTTRRGASRRSITDAGRASATGWGWVPGPVIVRAVYAPALVAFVGGAGFQLAIVGVGDRLVPARPARSLSPGRTDVSRNYFARQRQQHGDQHDGHQQHVRQEFRGAHPRRATSAMRT